MKYLIGDWQSDFQLMKFDIKCWYFRKTKKYYHISLGKYAILIRRK